jgi:cytochrome c oxidase subunit 2
VLALSGCAGAQSTLDPAGRSAEWIANIFGWMAAVALIVWLLVAGLTIYLVRARARPQNERRLTFLIIGGGALLPTVVLGVLLAYGLSAIPDLVAPAPEGSLKIAVTGEQWWWRVRYMPPGRSPIDLANEIRLPVGEPVEFELDSGNVIHSFWIPPLGGKMDMIPGRRTRLSLLPTRTGEFRGACAEYCGESHALMAFPVVVHEKAEFETWLAQQARPAQPAEGPAARRGEELFFANGCRACHTIRGTPAEGVIGPDLTHVGSRLTLGAATLPNDSDAFVQWISSTEHIKPGAHMPPFGMLPTEDVRAIAAYLDSLR